MARILTTGLDIKRQINNAHQNISDVYLRTLILTLQLFYTNHSLNNPIMTVRNLRYLY